MGTPSELEKRLDQLPTRRFVVGCTVAFNLAFAVIITFAEKLQALVK